MKDIQKREQLVKRYTDAAHGMQTGVKVEMARDGHLDDTRLGAVSPKHLRVGVNTAKVDQAALAGLLMAKGLITEEEYLTALAEGMEREHRRYEALLGAKLG
jgi:hypothetical protein